MKTTKTNSKTTAKTAPKTTAKTTKAAFPKTVCPLTKKQFADKAQTLTMKVGQDSINVLDAEPREFSSGSLGWYFSGKAVVEIDGKPVKCQVGCNVIVIGSKEIK